MLKLLERTLVNRAYQLTRTLIFPARAETVESTLRTVEDGGRERFWSGSEPKPVSADQIHSTHGTQSPRVHETASSIVGGSWAHMAVGINTRNRATMKKSSLVLKLKAYAGQRFTLFERLDWKTPGLDTHTREPIMVITERYLGVLRFCKWSQLGCNQKLEQFISEIRVERSHSMSCTICHEIDITTGYHTVAGWKYIHTRKNNRI